LGTLFGYKVINKKKSSPGVDIIVATMRWGELTQYIAVKVIGAYIKQRVDNEGEKL